MAQLIANPIYDSAFKYMMQNERAATVLLENLLGKEILKLDILTNDTPVIEEKTGNKYFYYAKLFPDRVFKNFGYEILYKSVPII